MDENKRKYVLDASVVLKWVLIEDADLEQAMILRDEFLNNQSQILVPAHFLSEIANTLGRKNPKGALNFLSKLTMGGVLEHRLSLDLADIALKLVQKHAKISFYDAFYHAIALKHGVKFITADERYYKITKGEGSIELLKNYARA